MTSNATPLWTSDALVAASAGVVDGVMPREITGVSIDTRSIGAGELFVALKDVRDGHEFVTAAFAKGAGAALVRRDYSRKSGDGALIRVDDPLKALERIGIAARSRLSADARVVAITGSAGKTGTKEMLRACLAPFGKTHAPEKSFNNHWGVPLTLARMPADTQYAVIEMGMNHAGEITPLSEMTRPHVAIITNVLPVHIGNFPEDGEIGIAKAKSEIFAGLLPGGVAILPRDNPHFERLAAAARAKGAMVKSFGLVAGADVRADAIVAHEDRSDVRVGPMSYTVGMPGRHVALNSLAVVAALSSLSGFAPRLERALEALGQLGAPSGRGARTTIAVPGGEILLIDESYNANPASMRAALATMASVPRERYARRIAVLGDMRELGADSARFHAQLKEPVEASGADLVFTCGPFMEGLFKLLPTVRQGASAPNSTELVAAVVAAICPGDVVMIKGSLGTNMAPLVAAVRGLAVKG